MRSRENATIAVQRQPIRPIRFSLPLKNFETVGSSATSIAQAAQAVWPDGKERNSSDETPSATSWFLSVLPAFHHGVK